MILSWDSPCQSEGAATDASKSGAEVARLGTRVARAERRHDTTRPDPSGIWSRATRLWICGGGEGQHFPVCRVRALSVEVGARCLVPDVVALVVIGSERDLHLARIERYLWLNLGSHAPVLPHRRHLGLARRRTATILHHVRTEACVGRQASVVAHQVRVAGCLSRVGVYSQTTAAGYVAQAAQLPKPALSHSCLVTGL